jgi:hypothetical protein
VPSYLEVVLGEERSIDYSEEVGLAGLHVQLVAFFRNPFKVES